MKLLRKEIEGQGVMYAEGQVILFPPEYLIKYSSPKGDVPVGAWEVTYYPSPFSDLSLHRYKYRFPSQEEALSFIIKLMGEPVVLETAKEREERR